MSLSERVDRDLIEAMRGQQRTALDTLRMLKTALTNRQVEKGRSLDEAESAQVVSSLIKQRRESIEHFQRGGRQDLADREAAEIGVLERYQAPPIDPAELDAAIEAAVTETGATSPRDLGKVMKAAMTRLAGRVVDGKTVSERVRRRLGG